MDSGAGSRGCTRLRPFRHADIVQKLVASLNSGGGLSTVIIIIIIMIIIMIIINNNASLNSGGGLFTVAAPSRVHSPAALPASGPSRGPFRSLIEKLIPSHHLRSVPGPCIDRGGGLAGVLHSPAALSSRRHGNCCPSHQPVRSRASSFHTRAAPRRVSLAGAFNTSQSFQSFNT